MNFNEYVEAKFKENPKLREEYEKIAPQYEIISAVIGARIEQGITQAQLAEMAGTKQSNISRFESGNYNPSLAFLQKIASALGLELSVSLKEAKAS